MFKYNRHQDWSFTYPEFQCIFSNDQEQAIEAGFNTYLKTRMAAMDNKIPLAPVDTK